MVLWGLYGASDGSLPGREVQMLLRSVLAPLGGSLQVGKDKEQTKVQGIRFCKDGYSFKGTQISYAKPVGM